RGGRGGSPIGAKKRDSPSFPGPRGLAARKEGLSQPRQRSTPLAMASSLRMRSLRSASSMRAAPSRAPPSISCERRPVSSSRLLRASQSCQPLSMAPATTMSPIRVLAAISRSWLIVASLLALEFSFLAQAVDLGREPPGLTVLGGDPFEHLDPFAELLDLALERGVLALDELLVAHDVGGDSGAGAVPGLDDLSHADQGHDDDDGSPETHCAVPLLSIGCGRSRSASIWLARS